jgi:hypothetical protein
MMNDFNEGPVIPDPRLAAALRWAEGEAPVNEVDWEALHGAIHARAELSVARRRRTRQRARWTRSLVPLAVAAGIGGAALVGGTLRDRTQSAPLRTATADPAVSAEEVLTSNLTDEEFRLLVTSRSDPDGMLRMAIDER